MMNRFLGMRLAKSVSGCLVVCLMTLGCVVGPGLSLHVDEYMRPIESSELSGKAHFANAGQVLVSNSPLFEVESLTLEHPFEGKIPGTLGVNFNFKIDSCPMILSYQDEKWLYYVARKNCVAAWYNQTSVFTESDHAGIRVLKTNHAEREWFVDNSLYNGLAEHGWARWHRKIRSDDGVNILSSPATVGPTGNTIKWLRYDGASSGVWNFTYFESIGGDETERSIRLDAKAGEVLSVNGAKVRVAGEREQRLEYAIVSDFSGNTPELVGSGGENPKSTIPSKPPENTTPPESSRNYTRSGTCFAVSPDGLILTANHVVTGAESFAVQFEGREPLNATVRQVSPASDLALLKVDSSTKDYLSLAPPRSARVGQRVFTMGYPAVHVLGAEPKYSEGTVSALSGIQGEAAFLQISVPIQPGNSGGALIDDAGRVVGIITSTAAVSAFLKVTGTLPQNVSWAVKSELAAALFDQPAKQSRSLSRDQLISAATRSTCLILAE